MSRIRKLALAFGLSFAYASLAAGGRAASSAVVHIEWNKIIRVSRTTATLQVVVNPPLRRGSAIHDRVFDDLRDLGCEDVRYVPWLPYPKLAVAELEPPHDGKTSWDFSLIDPMMEDFMNATSRHSVIINFSTIPEWMFKTAKPVTYPSDPDKATWDYEQGKEFRDPSLKQVADYYARLASWYTRGGFTDEYGKRHESGHHYKITYWEVLNEVDFEHSMTPQTYSRVYDAITAAIHKVDPHIKFLGMALAAPSEAPNFFEYFLNHRNHKSGTPLDMISYHFYATPSAHQTPADWQYTFFDQADGFLNVVRYIQSIRQRLSPETETDADELGAILPTDNNQGSPGYKYQPIPNSYWNLCAAMYAYLYARLAQQGVQIAGESQLVGYPTQFPSVTMVDWKTGQPNARYWVLKMLHENFGPGDKMLETHVDTASLFAQGFLLPDDERKVLLINKRNRPMQIDLPAARGAHLETVDQTTGSHPPSRGSVVSDQVTLGGYAVEVITWAK
jgi:Glycosyl hydrolases family 39